MNPYHEKPWFLPTFEKFLLEDCPRLTSTAPQHFVRDFSTLTKRLATEGLSFLTKTLPSFAKQIDLALQGHTALVVPNFRKSGRTSLPSFLKGLTSRVFSKSGWVLDNPCIQSIRLLRQALGWFKKLKEGFTDESLQDAVADFIAVDSSLPDVDYQFTSREAGVARAVIEGILRDMPDVTTSLPKHGPGAVANYDGIIEKRSLKTSYASLEYVFRPLTWMRSLRDVVEDLDEFLKRDTQQVGYSKLAFVPKDSSGPRTIGLEPAEYMWCQQAVKGLLYHHIERSSSAAGQVNFTDQTINRQFARMWESVETLDMSKASDRNSYALVKCLFEKTRLWPYLHASRTPGTVLPNGELLMYKKFAPMGSAVCFPIEALVFYALSVACLHLQGMPLFLAQKSVYVYGDDLIVPRGYFPALKDTFERHSLLFNENKCCIHGKFRESCGLDAYAGEDVTPIRAKNIMPGDESNRDCKQTDFSPATLASVVEHANNLMLAGYRSAARAFKNAALCISPRLRAMHLPVLADANLPFLFWTDPEAESYVKPKRSHSIDYVKGWCLEPRKVLAKATDEMRYLRESLCHGGPVGSLIRTPSGWVRKLDKRFDVRLRRKRFVVCRGALPLEELGAASLARWLPA